MNVYMRHRLTVPAAGAALMLAALALLAIGGAGAATAGRGPLQQRTAGQIESLAMDGSRIAFDVAGSYGSQKRCNEVYVWNVARRSTTEVSGRQTCDADNSSTGSGVRQLALAGGRAAWIVNQGGNSESADHLYVSTLARPHERVLASAFRSGDVSGILTGNWLGGLVGAKGFLGVNHWATDSNGAVTTARLQAVGARLSDLATGPATRLARSSDGKLVAVLHDDATVGVYTTGGKLLGVVAPGTVTEVAVRGDYLAVLTTADRLVVYNSHSGKRLHSWRVAHHARSLDISSGYAAYAAPFPAGGYTRVVHIRALKSGRDRVLLTTPPELLAVRLEPAGLAYAVNRIAPNRPGTVAFVPMRSIVRTLRAR